MPVDNAVIVERLKAIAEDVSYIKGLIDGEGDASKGLIVRVDRLEQQAASRKWYTHTAIGAALTSLVGMILKHFRVI